MIEVRHLDKYYAKGSQKEVHAVRDTTLQLPDTGIVALFGASGCGKTTLLNIIGGLDTADSGEVLLDGARVTPKATETRNRHIGYIFQNYHLIADETVYENVALSLRLCGVTDDTEIEKRTMAALEAVEMEMYCRRLPGTLSGGQQQRVAIARALVKNPHLILADEPTGNLDEQNTVMVMELLRQVARDHLVLLVTHEHDLLPYYCDRIIEISDGTVVSERENDTGDGYRSQNKSDVFLGDLPRTSGEVGTTFVEFFGDEGAAPQSLRLIAHGGTLYIAAPSNIRLRVLDSSAEVRVHEGSFRPEEHKPQKELPPVLLTAPTDRGKKCGRMYGFRNAIASGFRAHFGRVKRGKKVLIAGLFIFAITFVMMISYFGTDIRTLQEVRYKYNTDMVYVPIGTLTPEHLAEMRSHGLVDSVTFGSIREYDGSYYVGVTSYQTSWRLDLGVLAPSTPNQSGQDAQLLDISALSARKKTPTLPEGKYTNLSDGEVVISTGFADTLLKTTGVSYMRAYDDLMYHQLEKSDSYAYYTYNDGLENYDRDIGSTVTARKTSLTIVGIVEDRNPCLYVSPVVLTDSFTGPAKLNVSYMSQETWEVLGIDPPAPGILYARYKESASVAGTMTILTKTYQVDDVTLPALDDRELTEQQKAALDHLTGQYYMAREDYVTLPDNAFYAFASAVNPSFTHYALHTSNVNELLSYMEEKQLDDGTFTPHDLYLIARGQYIGDLIATLVTAAVFLLLMVLCLFLIMRSGLMASVRQIGILRAIGVSRGNLLFRFFAESLVVFTLTVLPGYLIASGSLAWITGKASAIISMIFYYPFWLAVITFLFLCGITVICGVLPILSLTRKTPAAIIAKYDI